MPDWSRVYQEFRPTYAQAYRRAAIIAVATALLCAAAGAIFYWQVDDAKVPAYIAWGAGAVLLLMGLRHVIRSRSKTPFVLTGRVVKKHAVVRADAHRTKYTKPMVGMEVGEAFEISPEGRGSDLPQKTGVQLMVVSRFLFSRVSAGDKVMFVCMPSGEAVGLLVGERLAVPSAEA